MEPLSVAVHAVGRIPLAAGDTALVIGTGFIGLLVVQLLRRAGCSQIVAVDRNRWKLALAEELGATHAMGSDLQAVPTLVRELTGGRGADVAVDAAGHGTSLAMAVASLRKGGALCQIGNYAPEIALPLQTVVMSELTVYGTATALGEEESQSLALLVQGEIATGPLVKRIAPLAEGSGWFDRLRSRERGLLKVILEPEQ